MYYSAELLLTTQQTTYRFGALGDSGDKSAEERGFPSGKGQKKLFLAEIAFIRVSSNTRNGNQQQEKFPFLFVGKAI